MPLIGPLTACSSLSVEDATPRAAVQPALAPVAARPTQPDGYPNLNVPVTAASPQLTAEERELIVRDLSVARQQQAGGSAAQALSESERLRLLARSHGEETLGRIEGAQ